GYHADPRLCRPEAARRQGRVIDVLYAGVAGNLSASPPRHGGDTSWCRPTAGGGFKTISLPRSVTNPPPRHRRHPRRWVYDTFNENSVINPPLTVGTAAPPSSVRRSRRFRGGAQCAVRSAGAC